MRVTFRISQPGTITYATAPDTAGGRLDGLYVETEGERAVFETVIEPEQLTTNN